MRRRGGPCGRPAAHLASLLLILVSFGCATNPATGKRQLSLIGEREEIALGRESHAEVLAAFGDYEDDALEAYVRGIGERLAAESERPDLPWTFEVLDDASVNAMALPGGFIYVTRGILAHMSSEAELAGVLGHEIGHVTARHSVNQLSKQQLYGGLLTVGMIASPELRSFGDLAGTGLGLLFLKFGRDAERQADDLGLRYMLRGGYDPRAMPGMFEMLEVVSALGGAGRAPSWMSTHPNPDARGERSEAAIARLDPASLGGTVGRDEHLARIDGLVFGSDPREGYFLGSTFLHPELGFGIDFPAGWETFNGKSSVVAAPSERDVLIELTLVEAESAAAAAREFMSQEGVTAGRGSSARVNGLEATGGTFEAVSGEQTLSGAALFIELGGSIYRLLGYGLTDPFAASKGAVESSLRSFRRVDTPAVLAVEPDRLELVRIEREMTLEAFDERYPSVIELDALAALNRVDAGAAIPRGTVLKRVRGRRPLPAER